MMATPLSATKFLEIMRAEGLSVSQPYSDWKTRGRDAATGKTFGPVHGVVIHHTAGADSLKVVHDGTGDLPGPLCHGHLPKTGVLNAISVHRANHAGTFAQNAYDAMLNESPTHPRPSASEPVDANDSTYGLEVENKGDGKDQYPWKQYVAIVKFATAICRYYGWSQDSVIGHKEGTTRKIDPKGPVVGPDGKVFDFTMDRFRKDVKAALALPAGKWQGAATTPEEEDDVALSADDIKKVAAEVKAQLLADRDLLAYIVGTDNVLKAGDDNPDNTYWAWGSFVTGEYKKIARTEGKIDALAEKVASIEVGGVNEQALAARVADLLAERLAN